VTRHATILVLLLRLAGHTAASTEAPWRAAIDRLGLPLTIVSATTPPRAFLVLMSGDGGWAEVDQAVAAGLARHGVTTIGWSSLRYFVTTQPMTTVAGDLRRVVDALVPAHLPIYAGGYSFGAEVAPVVMAQRWPERDRARIAGLLLLGPSASATFRVNPLDWIREPPPDPRHRVDDAVRRLSPMTILCVTGGDDATCICPSLADVPGVVVVRVPGSHHFENGIPAVIDAAMTRLFTNAPEAP